ncbi:MAG: transposase [Rhodobacteraceae bacterium]|nr:transposase [Paracoccaceae bacterium]
MLFHGYATGVHSSRKLEAATHDSVAVRFITGNLHPDHDTIARFRRRHLSALQDLFLQVLAIARTMGVLKLGHVILDGTKVKANASRHRAMSWAHMERVEVRLQAEVSRLLELAETADGQDCEFDIPEELCRREGRLARIDLPSNTVDFLV